MYFFLKDQLCTLSTITPIITVMFHQWGLYYSTENNLNFYEDLSKHIYFEELIWVAGHTSLSYV